MESAVMMSPAKGWEGFEPLKARMSSIASQWSSS
jgi:hypothetical protein